MNRYREFDQIFKRWTPPRELLHSPPRQVQLNGGGIALAVLAASLAVGAVVGGGLLARESLRQEANYEAILAEGREIDAHVQRLWQKKGENKRTMVEYRFDLDGRSYRRETSVPTALWKTLKAGGSIRVTYLPSNPEHSQLYNRPRRRLSIWVPMGVGACAMGFAFWIVMALARSRELLEEGRVAPGVVTKVQETKGEHGTTLTIHYEFALLNGAIVKGKCSSGGKGMAEGSVVSVVYDPNRSSRRALYPMQLVKVRRDT